MAQQIGLRINNRVERGVTITSEVLGDVDGVSKVIKVVQRVLELFNLSEGFTHLQDSLKTWCFVMEPFHLFNTIKDWFKLPEKNWRQVAALVSSTCLTFFGIGEFLDDNKLTNFGNAIKEINSESILSKILNLPIIESLDCFISVSNLIDNYNERTVRILPRVEHCKARLRIWKARKEAFDTGGDIEQKIRNQWNKLAQFQDARQSDFNTSNDYLNYKISKWESELQISKFEEGKSLFKYTNECSKVFLIVLKVFIFSNKSIFILGLGLIVAIIGLGSKFYQIAYKDLPAAQAPTNVILFREALKV